MSQTHYWMVSLPNENKPSEQAFRNLKESAVKNLADVFKVDIPSLQVGTLDSLMAMSDDLVRIDMLVENVVRKIEKQYQEVAGDQEPLKVGGVSAGQYVRLFEWDFAKFAVRQRLPALVSLIQGSVGKIEEEHRNLSMVFAEKNQSMQALKRKKGSNLASVELSEVLTEDKLRGVHMMNTEHLLTLCVAVQKAQEKEWLATYESIGDDIASLGAPDWSSAGMSSSLGRPDGQFGPTFANRAAVKGSPVVPGSTQKILEEGDMLLYTVTILKGHYQAGFHDGEHFQNGMFVDYTAEFKRRCKEKRFTARDFVFDPTKQGQSQIAEEQLKLEVQQLQAGMIRWCRAHFGEAFSAWMHVKVVKLFVESVMRYGLPIDFTAYILAPKKGSESKLKDTLDDMYAYRLEGQAILEGGGGGGDDGEKEEEYSAYVYNTFSLAK